MRSTQRVEVTAPRRRRLGRAVTAHNHSLAADEITTVRNIPVTTLPRTLLDLAAVVPTRQVERAANEAEVRRLGDPSSLADLVERHPRCRGVGAIKAILANSRLGFEITRSELEGRFRDVLVAAGLPAPELNAPLFVAGRWIECDCVWRAHGLVIELDGRAAHGTAAAFERDRARDRALHTAGWRVVRITWRQLHDDRAKLAADLRRLLQTPSRR
ncbi:MAG TPA: DUF559 domain-containing protein [Solirubrobacteraceae bacterium]|nr:DUF559 domain-containing protein [Solirubrobacteraceae bacterium]